MRRRIRTFRQRAARRSLLGLERLESRWLLAGEQLMHVIPNPSTAPQEYSAFGGQVATDGARGIVGAPEAYIGGFESSGVAYLYDLNNSSQPITLANPTPDYYEQFGYSVAIDGPLAVVGAPESGAGNVYVYDSLNGDLLRTLDNPHIDQDYGFGHSVAISGSTIVVGLPTSSTAYLFDASTGDLLHTIVDPALSSGDEFGSRVAISGNHVLISDPQQSVGLDAGVGNAHLFDAVTGALLQTFDNPTPVAEDEFGDALAIDGATIVIGAWGDSTRGSYAGEAYVFDASTGDLSYTLYSPNATESEYFGSSVSVAAGRVFVGAPSRTSAALPGSVYVYDANSGGYLSILSDPQPNDGERFGAAVSASATRTFVGATYSEVQGLEAGQAFVFTAGGELEQTFDSNVLSIDEYFGINVDISGDIAIAFGGETLSVYEFSTGNLLYQLTSPEAETGSRFNGSAVISGNRIAVGASNTDESRGAVFIYDASSGALLSTLRETGGQPYDYFGSSLALDGSLLAVSQAGTSGNLPVLVYDITTGALLQTLADPADGPALNGFGDDMVLQGNTLVVGAPYTSTGSGVAYVFDATSGQLLHTLANPTPEDFDWFGFAIALHGQRAVIGAPLDDTQADSAGAAYVFDTTTGALLSTLLEPAATAEWDDQLGRSVAISETSIYAGAIFDDPGEGVWSGSVHVFDTATGDYQQRLTYPNPKDYDFFGDALAVDGHRLVVGADEVDGPTWNRGAIYLYSAPLATVADSPFTATGTLPTGSETLALNFDDEVAGADQASAYELRRAGADGLLGTADDVLVALTAEYSGTTATLSFDALLEDVYRLKANDAITHAVSGQPLDGDGDGIGGGAYSADFVVGALTHTLTSPGGYEFDVQYGGWGAGQLVEGPEGAFDGLGRLTVGGSPYQPLVQPLAAATTLRTSLESSLASSFIDIPGLTTTITLSEDAVVRMSSQLNLTSMDNTAWSGAVRFAINGTPEADAATFENPYLLPSLTGLSGSATVSIDPPSTTTSSAGAHTHGFQDQFGQGEPVLTHDYYSQPTLSGNTQSSNTTADGTHVHTVNIGSFSSQAHSHSISLSPSNSERNLQVDADDWVTLPAGTYTITVQSRATGAVDFHGEQRLDVVRFAEAVADEQKADYTGSASQSFTDIPGLTTTITLSEDAVVRMSSQLNLTSMDNTAWSGAVRFAINGTPEADAATFENPYLLPSLTGLTGSATVSIDPPSTTTSSAGAHTHGFRDQFGQGEPVLTHDYHLQPTLSGNTQSSSTTADGTHVHTVNIGSFSSQAHSHSISLSPSNSERNLQVDADDWVTLPAGTYTITVQARATGAVDFNGEQSLDVVRFAEAVADEQKADYTGSAAPSFTDIPGLTTTITLSEDAVVRMGSQLNLTSTDNIAWSGAVRFAINGTPEADAAIFENPYLLPSLTGLSGSATVGIDPPSTTTSSAGAHTHGFRDQFGQVEPVLTRDYYSQPTLSGNTQSSNTTADGTHVHTVDIGSFASQAHSHFVSLSPSNSERNLQVDADDWVTLPAGTYTITVQARATGAVGFNGEQSLDVVSAYALPEPIIKDADVTIVTKTETLMGLHVHREVTVPSTGNEDFARILDVFHNPTTNAIATIVQFVGNLGTDGATTVFATSDGDLLVEPTDQWFGTDDADGSGAPAVIHYIHRQGGLRPSSVSVVDDNVEWTYTITVPAGETQRLAHFTILGDTRAEAIAAAETLITPSGFGGEATAFLSQAELDSLVNFQMPGLVINASGVEVSENGSAEQINESFSVVLNAAPSSNVVIHVDIDNPDQATVSTSMLTFTPTDWDTPQTVTVAGVHDRLIDGDQAVTLTLAVDDAQSDVAYSGTLDQTVEVLIRDVPLPPSVSGPTETAQPALPTFDFSAVAGATHYSLYLIDMSTSPASLAYANFNILPADLPFTLPEGEELDSGSYRYFIRAHNDHGYSDSAGASDGTFGDFTVGSGVTGPPAPTSATSASGDPTTIQWLASQQASSYEIYVVNLASGEMAASVRGIVGTSYQLSLADGSYRVFVRAWNARGDSGFGAPYDFSVGAPLVPPATTTATAADGNPPVVQWPQADRASSYEVYMVNLTTGEMAASVRGLDDTSYAHGSPLSDGKYRIFVRAWNGAGTSGWGSPYDFVIGTPLVAPTVPTNLTAFDTDTARPTLYWKAVANEGNYSIWFVNLDSGTLVASVTVESNLYTPDFDLDAGNYGYYVKAHNAAGSSAFSPRYDFTVAPPSSEIRGLASEDDKDREDAEAADRVFAQL